ncbi:Casein kinase II, alpha subunit [Trachipleistophora hominis]|uniref:Casein kinase II subunit alpha n=1 Tax=Trachipleistophora hominis TaxID=72359 RepID=L7JSY6_TRAHO|nr:Casein kinase II, alpha subunit [Trachipleistophora hominis]
MVIPTVSKVHANFCQEQPPEYYSYEEYEPEIGNIDNYKIIKRLGRGKYSEVFKGICTLTKSFIAIKVLKPVRQKKINREVLVLKQLDHPNIVRMVDVVKDSDTHTYSIIFEYLEHRETRVLFTELSRKEFAFYAKQVLSALDYAHSRGIIHRDIKPHNMIICKDSRTLKIIDWGLAEFYLPGTAYNVKVASRFYKGPELLVDYNYYDYSLDMWSFGCIVAEYFTKKSPFFFGKDNIDQLFVITEVLGRDDFYAYVKKYQISLEEGIVVSKNTKRKKFNVDIGECVIDLLDKLLVYDHCERLSAKECLEHNFFNK